MAHQTAEIGIEESGVILMGERTILRTILGVLIVFLIIFTYCFAGYLKRDMEKERKCEAAGGQWITPRDQHYCAAPGSIIDVK